MGLLLVRMVTALTNSAINLCKAGCLAWAVPVWALKAHKSSDGTASTFSESMKNVMKF